MLAAEGTSGDFVKPALRTRRHIRRQIIQRKKPALGNLTARRRHGFAPGAHLEQQHVVIRKIPHIGEHANQKRRFGWANTRVFLQLTRQA